MNRELEFLSGTQRVEPAGLSLRTLFWVLVSGAVYYLATRIAWLLCFPDSKVSLFFPPHAVLVSILLLVPTRHWWAYLLSAACSHFFATQQAGWPPLYALQCEVFDAAKNLLMAGGIRFFIKSPFRSLTLRDAIVFVLIAVVIVPFGIAFWGAAFTISSGFGTHYWVEWRNLGISNAVTVLVLVPAILIGVHYVSHSRTKITPSRVLETGILATSIVIAGVFAFDWAPAGPASSPALLYAPVPLLLWAALRFGLGGMSAAMLVITSLAIWGTMNGRGPFLTQSPAENALALQLFLLVVATPLLLLTVAVDDERRSKDALRASEERMGLAAESAQLSFWEWDMTHDDIWMTEEGRKFFGFEPEERLHAQSLDGRVHPDDRAARAAAVRQARETGGAYEIEYRIVQPDGSVRWIAARGRNAQSLEGGGTSRLLGVSMDITQRKKADTELQLQREELAHFSRVASLSVLSSSLAHELNQPLGSILSNAQAAQHLLAKEPPDLVELREILADIVSEDRRAGEVIQRLRTLLRRGEVALRPVDVNVSIEELLRLIRSNLTSRSIDLSCQFGSGMPPARTDGVQLQQVILNLIVNACDAMETNPPGARQMTITTFAKGAEIRIAVQDCGVGLPENVEGIFQPFQSTKANGLGMGLAICRALIIAHGGQLWAEPREGRGAAFHVSLLVAKEPA